MQKIWVFDMPHYVKITEARQRFLKTFLPQVIKQMGLQTALDTGCGVGYFSAFLHDLNLQTTAFDGRSENVEEARRRHPDISFYVDNIEDPSIRRLGEFDLVLCLGLLYHLENPFVAIRNLHALTGKLLLIESMKVPESHPILVLRDEGYSEDQSLRFIAIYPSEDAIIKMCYRAGFPFVYRFNVLPDHEDFQATLWRHQARTMLAASKVPLNLPHPILVAVPEPMNLADPWETIWGRKLSLLRRLYRFLRKPWSEKVKSLRFRFKRLLRRIFTFMPLPMRLPFGGWWIAWNDVCSDAIFIGSFEEAEWRFVERFLQPGMVALDIGAHHGFYALLASKKVGPYGQVIAFEPSPRERGKLLWHLRLNLCSNVYVEGFALGNQKGEAEFFLVNGRDTGCNSLRPPNVAEPVKTLSVPVVMLDDYLQHRGIERVDFIKMDVEGAELEVLKGAPQLLQRLPRPVILCEVQDIRTRPWGYSAQEIMDFLQALGYRWFLPMLDGSLISLPPDWQQLAYNFVAVPHERMEQIQPLLGE